MVHPIVKTPAHPPRPVRPKLDFFKDNVADAEELFQFLQQMTPDERKSLPLIIINNEDREQIGAPVEAFDSTVDGVNHKGLRFSYS